MAFIPDNSFDQRLVDKISPILWAFYEYLCRKRNHEKRISTGTVDEFISKYGYKRASRFNLIKEIKATNWISGQDGKYSLDVGDFSSVDKKADERKAKKEQSKKIDSPQPKSKILDLESKEIDNQSKKIDSHIRNIPASLPAEEIKPIGDKSPLPKKSKSDNEWHSDLMKYHAARITVIENPAAQGKAAKWLWESREKLGISLDDCLRYYDFQVWELRTNLENPKGWRSSVSWLTVKGGIGEWVKAGKPDITKIGVNNGKNQQPNRTKQTAAEIITNRPYYRNE